MAEHSRSDGRGAGVVDVSLQHFEVSVAGFYLQSAKELLKKRFHS